MNLSNVEPMGISAAACRRAVGGSIGLKHACDEVHCSSQHAAAPP